MKILLTGFEPFGGSAVNPSQQVVQALAANPPSDIDLVTAILPVERVAGPQRLLEAVQAFQPQAVLCLGEASRRAVVSIERVALNLLDYRIPDYAGQQCQDEAVFPDGPAAYFVTLPVRAMLAAIQAAGVPAELSLSAGAYLCNQVLYTLLHTRSVPGGFIHLPSLPEQAAAAGQNYATMSAAESEKAIRAALLAVQQNLPV